MENEKSQLSASFEKKYLWLKYMLVFLSAEKVIQHVFVTISFYLNIGNVRARVVPDYNVLMITGGVVAILFAMVLWMLYRNIAVGIRIVFVLALFDIIGEFIAQGTIGITITVSFIIAITLLVSAITYEKKVLSHAASLGARTM
jgi:hypothetical protein